jgi:hypothetical protein
MPPLGSVHSITETSAYAYGSGDTAYYNSAGSGQFSVRVAAGDTGSGLDQATYPETTSPGGVYNTALDEDYQYQHTYTFDGADTASGTYSVTLQDGIGRQSSVDFSVIRDTTPPTLTLEAVVQGSDVHVTWSAADSGSGVDTSTCLLEVREDDGDWQTFSTECGGEDATYDGQPGYTYTFRLSASDNVSNAASLEVQAVVPYVTKYYYANGQRVAMQKEGVVYCAQRPPGLHQPDHLREPKRLRRDAVPRCGGAAVVPSLRHRAPRRRHLTHRLHLHRATQRGGPWADALRGAVLQPQAGAVCERGYDCA